MLPAARRFWWPVALGVIVVAGVALRLAVLSSPLGELDADEAVTGLMARHIAFLGERPLFYWGQSYLGTLEQFSVAPFFLLFGAATFWLKLVPALYSLGFVVLSGVVARHMFGAGPALATAAYLALPPAMLALWSTKARGGYAELLALGEALLLVTLLLARSPSAGLALLCGTLGGLALWTHLLAVVYLVPCVAYLLLRGIRASHVLALAAGFLVGAAPLLLYNLQNDWVTSADLIRPSPLPFDPLQQVARFFRVSVPVLLGVGVPVPPSDREFFDRAYVSATAGPVWAAALGCLLVLAALAMHLPSVRACVARRPGPAAEPTLLLGVVLLVAVALTLTSYGYFASEPRYALPAYAAVPLLFAAVWRLPKFPRLLVVGALAVLHARSLLLAPLFLFGPDIVQADAATRAQLIQALEQQQIQHIHTEYWIAQPVMFESGERILANVVHDGPNRNLRQALPVANDPNAAWVFQSDTEGERELLSHLAAASASPNVATVSLYHVYTGVPTQVLDAYP